MKSGFDLLFHHFWAAGQGQADLRSTTEGTEHAGKSEFEDR